MTVTDREQPSAVTLIMLGAIREIEGQIAEAAAKLPRVSPDNLEKLASKLSGALSDQGSELPKEAADKGRAIIALFAATAEFQRAASKYAEASLLQMIAAEKTR